MPLFAALVASFGAVLAVAGLRLALYRPRPLDLAGMLLAPAGVWLFLAGVAALLPAR